jgi:hypothetical protein
MTSSLGSDPDRARPRAGELATAAFSVFAAANFNDPDAIAFCLNQLSRSHSSLQILLDERRQVIRIKVVIHGNVHFYCLKRKNASFFQTLNRIPQHLLSTWMKGLVSWLFVADFVFIGAT